MAIALLSTILFVLCLPSILSLPCLRAVKVWSPDLKIGASENGQPITYQICHMRSDTSTPKGSHAFIFSPSPMRVVDSDERVLQILTPSLPRDQYPSPIGATTVPKSDNRYAARTQEMRNSNYSPRW
ncbi:unnamed protein product [Aspergillus oryzae var. brunneus]|uniref:Unnamed protein product n=2 Tax=Aspergillus oryzae TaxID=5062 RepID=A0AAN5C029_ASPOZ|nr:unnamed protein product [Aspergillus oryzae]GMG32338.1 unnamed protein product [Aspergillus oryzae]GMG41275.1 unnamed protein product [Aspergillus oryzae var. brunneus]